MLPTCIQCSLIFIREMCFLLVGMNTNEGITIQRSEQQLSSVSSKPFHDQKSEANDEKKALAAYKNKQYVKKVGGETVITNKDQCLYKSALPI